jgi:hypothetical protein
VSSGGGIFSEFFTDLVSDFFLVFAFLGHLFIAYSVPDDLLGLTNDDVLPRGRRFGRLIITVSHVLRLTRAPGDTLSAYASQRATLIKLCCHDSDQN